jgi:hypothetical protein
MHGRRLGREGRTRGRSPPASAAAPADAATRAAWLERLFEAHAADEIPYIEQLADHWGELCASADVACRWVDRLLDVTRMALSPDPNLRGHFHGTSACPEHPLSGGPLRRDHRSRRGQRHLALQALGGAGAHGHGPEGRGNPLRGGLPEPVGERPRDRRALRGDPVVFRTRRRGVRALRPPSEPGGDVPRHVPRGGGRTRRAPVARGGLRVRDHRRGRMGGIRQHDECRRAARGRIRTLVASETASGRFVTRILGSELGLV